MKVKRSWLIAAPIVMALFLVIYTIARQGFGFSLGETFEKNMVNGIIVVALVVMFLNRKIVADEKKEREAEEKRLKEQQDE